MSQKNIDFGSFPDDPDSDSIRAAFNKVQQNFDELFSGLEDQAVVSVNAGAGITIPNPTGNVTVTAKIACVKVISNTLSLGNGVLSALPGGQTVVYNNSASGLAFSVDLKNETTISNLLLVGNGTSYVQLANTGNVTATGTLYVGNASSNTTITNGNITAVNVTASGNVSAGNLSTTGNLSITGALSVTGNANVGNIGATNAVITSNVTAGNVFANSGTVGAANLTGTLTTAAQPNITSVGNLTSLVVTGNATAGNIISNNDVTGITLTGNLTTAAQPNITSVGNLTSLTVTGNTNANVIVANYFSGDGSNLSNVIAVPGPNIVNGNSNVNIPAGNGNVTVSVAGNSNIAVFTGTGANISGTANVTGNLSAANATLGNLVVANFFSGNANLLSNIPGANVTGTVANATHSTTSNTVTTAAQPNITSVGTLSSLIVTGNVTAGNLGTSGALSVTGNANVGNIGATNGVFTNVSGNGASLSSLTGANVTGQVANALVAGTVYTAAQPNITSVGTLTTLGVSGTVTAANITANTGVFTGNGSGLTNLPGANVTGTVANATHACTANTVTNAAQSNITSVGTLTGLGVNGNIVAVNIFANTGNIQANSGVFIGNGSGLQTLNGSNLTTGTVPVGRLTGTYTININGGATTAATVTVAAQPNITSLGNLTSANVLGNLSAGNANLGNLTVSNYFQGDGSLLTNISVAAGSYILNGNSNVNVVTDGNVNISVNGVANSTVFTSNGLVTTQITATNVNANINGTVLTAAQPNITSVGNLTSLTVSGVSNLGPASNVTITGGNANYYLTTDGSGGLTWTSGSFSPPGGSNTSVQFNDSGNLGGVSALTFNKSSNVLYVGGNITAGNVAATLLTGTLVTVAQPNITSVGNLLSLNVVGNITSGNINGGNLVQGNFLQGTLTTGAQPNITSVGTLSSLTVTGNVSAGNVSATLLTGTLTTAAQPNITSVGTLTTLTVTGNVVGGNLSTGGNLNVTGNATISGNINTGNIYGIFANGTSNVRIVQDANINLSAAGNANVLVVTGTGVNVSGTLNATGTLSVTGNANVNNLGTTQVLATANVIAPQLISNVVTGTAPLVVTSTTVVANLRAATSNVANTVNDAAQPNITSLGTLSSLTVSGNTTSGNFIGVFANGNSNIAIPSANGNITFGISGTANGAILYLDSAPRLIVGTTIAANINKSYISIGPSIELYTSNTITFRATAYQGATPFVEVYTRGSHYINPTSGVTAIEANGNVIVNGLTAHKVGSYNANGTTSGTAAGISADIVNILSVTSTNRGVVLPDPVYGNNNQAFYGYRITIRNGDAANNLYVYPNTGGTATINGSSSAYQQAPGTVITYICFAVANAAAGTWYTNGATYA